MTLRQIQDAFPKAMPLHSDYLHNHTFIRLTTGQARLVAQEHLRYARVMLTKVNKYHVKGIVARRSRATRYPAFVFYADASAIADSPRATKLMRDKAFTALAAKLPSA